MKKKHKKKPFEQREIAAERINKLFKQAKEMFKESPELSDRYVELARSISMKYKVKIPSKFKRKFCKHCHIYLVPSKNCRVRLTKHKVVYYCLNCKKYMRFPYSKKKRHTNT